MTSSDPVNAQLQLLLVLMISFMGFLVTLMIAMAFSFWQWRRQQRSVSHTTTDSTMTPLPKLDDIRALQEGLGEHIRWQAVIYHDSLLMPDSKTTAARSDKLDDIKKEKKGFEEYLRWQAVLYHDSLSMPDSLATDLLIADLDQFNQFADDLTTPLLGSISDLEPRIIEVPPPYSARNFLQSGLVSTVDVPLSAAATTIDLSPMSARSLPVSPLPPSVPKKSPQRRPAPLDLTELSQSGDRHHNSAHRFQRDPTPYPLARQLTPTSNESDPAVDSDEPDRAPELDSDSDSNTSMASNASSTATSPVTVLPVARTQTLLTLRPILKLSMSHLASKRAKRVVLVTPLSAITA